MNPPKAFPPNKGDPPDRPESPCGFRKKSLDFPKKALHLFSVPPAGNAPSPSRGKDKKERDETEI